MTHELKTVNPHFTDVWEGRKTFEIRKNDRDFKIGDSLILKEYDPSTDSYSGRKITCQITHILQGGEYGIDPDYCILSINVKIK